MERRKKRRVSGKHIVLGCFAAALMLALLLFAGERDMGLVLRMTLGRPLTEKDITHSAVVSLSGADAAELMRCLQGGAVTRRGSGTETGGREPALYLYWQQDGGKYQQFSFAGYEQRSAFEALCARLCG